ncbi:MAG TPA: C40 family peptidase [Acidimicrobiales bacterium]|jgi:cell wall-associated NlpC family hydrolase
MRKSVQFLLVLLALVTVSVTSLSLGVAVWVGGSAGTGPLGAVTPVVAPGGVGGSGPASIGTAAGESPVAGAAVAWALAHLGTPYRWGGEGTGGFDCSGLVQAAFAAAGVTLPRVAQDQYDAGPHLAPGTALEPGDLVFFGGSAEAVDHVGIVVGAGEMIDAPHSGAVVRVEPVWSDGYLGATRPAP